MQLREMFRRKQPDTQNDSLQKQSCRCLKPTPLLSCSAGERRPDILKES